MLTVVPANGAIDVAVDAVVQVNFSEPIDCATITLTSFTVGSTNGILSGTLSCSGNNVTFIPVNILSNNHSYELTISSSVRDIANNAMTSSFSSTFATAIAASPISYTIGGTVSGLTPGASITLQNNAGDDLTVSGNSNFYFSTPLTTGTNYNVAVLTPPVGLICSVSNGSGAVGSANVTNISIICNPKAWGTAKLIEYDNLGDAASPKIAIDQAGNATAVWKQDDGARWNIWANRYTADSGWGTPTLIESEDAGSATNPHIAVDTSGNTIAVWEQSDGTRYNIVANRYTVGSGWGTALIIDNAPGNPREPNVSFDSYGNAIAVWSQWDGTAESIWANRYSVGSGWGTAELIETDNTGPAQYVRIACDTNGNALAVWHQFDGTKTSIWASRYTVGNGWQIALPISTGSGSAFYPQIDIDDSGNATAVWYQSDGTRNNIWANRYTAGSGWGAAKLIEANDVDTAESPQVAVNSNGDAIVVWNGVWANHYTSGTGWDTELNIGTDSSLGVQVAIDIGGNAIAVWQQWDGSRYNIVANRFTAGSGWGIATPIEFNSGPVPPTSAANPRISVDPSGNAIAIWEQFDGLRYSIWVNHYQ